MSIKNACVKYSNWILKNRPACIRIFQVDFESRVLKYLRTFRYMPPALIRIRARIFGLSEIGNFTQFKTSLKEFPAASFTCVGVLWTTRYMTIVAILIQWDANKVAGYSAKSHGLAPLEWENLKKTTESNFTKKKQSLVAGTIIWSKYSNSIFVLIPCHGKYTRGYYTQTYGMV